MHPGQNDGVSYCFLFSSHLPCGIFLHLYGGLKMIFLTQEVPMNASTVYAHTKRACQSRLSNMDGVNFHIHEALRRYGLGLWAHIGSSSSVNGTARVTKVKVMHRREPPSYSRVRTGERASIWIRAVEPLLTLPVSSPRSPGSLCPSSCSTRKARSWDSPGLRPNFGTRKSIA
ncbi:hypothetical protein BKA70DRAFT_103539 [Coprinopsis sp. MPI-PUGE-AT-0042]|nr:hypothetical protein BKA70DRAFT_103539 [Coprinopsis sp. MPI-PUGE-AT-0042]